MFKEMVEKKHYTFQQGFSDWKEAVRVACQPLLADGTIDDIYPEWYAKRNNLKNRNKYINQDVYLLLDFIGKY